MGGYRFLKYVLILLAGTIFSAYFFYSVNDKYVTRNRFQVEAAKAKVQVKLLNELDKVNLAMESMETFIKNSDSLSHVQFSELTDPFLNELNGLILLGWGPELHNFEAKGILLNCKMERDTACKQGNTVLSFFESKNANRDAGLAQDFQTENGYTLVEAISSRKAIISRAFALTGAMEGRSGFLSLIPVFGIDGLRVRGVSFGLFDLDELIKETLVYELPILDIEITDNPTPASSPSPIGLENSKYIRGDTLRLAALGKRWTVMLSPKDAFKAYPHAAESYFVLLLGLLSSLLLAFVVKQRDEYAQRLSREVIKRTKELEDSNRLKETLLREIHHRVKNNLQIAASLMNLQKRKLADPDMIEALTSSQGRISAIALIHEEIYQHHDTKAVDLKNYLTDLIKYHSKISPSIDYEIDCCIITLDLDTAVPIALITSELLVNSLKHAFAEEGLGNLIRFKARKETDGQIILSVSDNGTGLPKGFDVYNTKGLGFEIVHKLCRQINAKFSFTTGSGGTTFTIGFKPRE